MTTSPPGTAAGKEAPGMVVGGVGSRSDCQLIDNTGRCLLLNYTLLVDISTTRPPSIPAGLTGYSRG